ncbi:MAG: hypothetical protein IPL46_27820 [Saprospiraceae bacterium]|nr:hypothetical protein [Saprospiraceae bacterium]
MRTLRALREQKFEKLLAISKTILIRLKAMPVEEVLYLRLDNLWKNGKWKMENWEGILLNGNILDNGQTGRGGSIPLA